MKKKNGTTVKVLNIIVRIIAIIFIIFIILLAIVGIIIAHETNHGGFAKPLIYIYPTEETIVNVKLGYPENLTTTYPEYNNNWEVLAKPDGTLADKNSREYYGLYWEGLRKEEVKFDDGFVVAREDSIKFLEEKLATLGLNSKESNEFIIYWLPKLQKNKYNLIRFASMDEINEEMPLTINPEPESLIRVYMEFKGLSKKIEIKEQTLSKVERNGYTVVEWGGTEVK